jgi:hypothetical protein
MVITLHFVSRLVIYQRVANATESNTNVTNTVKEGEEGEPTIIALPNDSVCQDGLQQVRQKRIRRIATKYTIKY